MKSLMELPSNYKKIFGVDLAKNKKLALFVNLLALGIAAAAVAVGCLWVSPLTLFDMADGLGQYCLRFGILLVSFIVYILLHEAVHGIFMWLYSGEKPFFGITPMYAYAGSKAYYGKGRYLVIALAPIVVWGIVLGVLSALVPPIWFWVVYAVQVINLSGAAGDLYVFFRFLKLPRDILVRDAGASMEVFAPDSQQSR